MMASSEEEQSLGPAKPRRGLLVVDHGTRSAEANARLARFAQILRKARPDWLVGHAHMELAEPDIDSGIDSLVAAGATEVLIHLHFLVAGFHVRESIPQAIDAARKRHSEIPINTTDPLGEDPRLVEIVVERMDAQLEGVPERRSSKA
jgi:sirohydrochlorin ferrochelatase